MRFALSTNWCNLRLESGEEIAEEALALGFDALELGYHTTQYQAKGFKAMLDRIPVGSVHAFCPVPLSAPQGYPELYPLASEDADARAIARAHVRRNVAFAADMGADTVVLHAGRVGFSAWWRALDTSVLSAVRSDYGIDAPQYARRLKTALRRRRARGARMLEVFKTELAALVPDLEKAGVVLALENLPYLEGFPDEVEAAALAQAFAGAPVAAWFDTGHDRVRRMHRWLASETPLPPLPVAAYRGLHVNDVVDFCDDHYAPGDGKVDFAALRPLAEGVRHVVLEPSASVAAEDLAAGLARLRALWTDGGEQSLKEKKRTLKEKKRKG